MADLDRAGFDGLLIWDAALLVESGGTKNMDRVVIVTTDPATQLRRLMQREGCTEEAARSRPAQRSSARAPPAFMARLTARRCTG